MPETNVGGSSEISSDNLQSDQEILNQAIAGNTQPQGEHEGPSSLKNTQAGAESCIILIGTARNMFGVSAPIPDHISEMWKNAYVQVANKYGFDLLGAWGPEISLVVASYLLIIDTSNNMPKEDNTPEEIEAYSPPADGYTPQAPRVV